jgi:sec-independent protein translocase protein TatA
MVSPGSLLLTLLVVVLVFGTKRLRNVGEDLGAAVKNFRKGLHGEAESPETSELLPTKKEDHV